MTAYLLKMIACSGILYTFYILFLSKEKMLVFNRFYLLGSLIVSFFIPLVTITVFETDTNFVSYGIADSHDNDYSLWSRLLKNLPMFLAIIWVLISLIKMMRFAINLYSINRIVKLNERIDLQGVGIILLNEKVAPHSFMRKIFMNKTEYNEGRIEKDILQHEMAHITQKHSWDILFIEIMKVICWFNPCLYLYKQSLKICHELLADDAVVKQSIDTVRYQKILLEQTVRGYSSPFASNFNYLTTKKRILMIKKDYSPAIAFLKSASILPLLALLIFIFADRAYAQQINGSDKAETPLPDNVKNLSITNKNGIKTAKIEYKNGKTITENISTKQRVIDFEKKYGVTVTPPPPPPPPARPADVAKLPADVQSIQYRMINNRREARVKYKDGSVKNAPIESENELKSFYEKYDVTPPPPPPPPSKAISHNEKTKVDQRFTPPVIVKDDAVAEYANAGHPKEAASFTPPKIVKDDEVKVNEITITEIKKDSPKGRRKKVDGKKFTPPKIVKDDEVEVNEITITEIKKDSPKEGQKKVDEKKFTPPKIVKDGELK